MTSPMAIRQSTDTDAPVVANDPEPGLAEPLASEAPLGA